MHWSAPLPPPYSAPRDLAAFIDPLPREWVELDIGYGDEEILQNNSDVQAVWNRFGRAFNRNDTNPEEATRPFGDYTALVMRSSRYHDAALQRAIETMQRFTGPAVHGVD